MVTVDPAGRSFELEIFPGYQVEAAKKGSSRYHVFDSTGRLLTWSQQNFENTSVVADRRVRVELARPSLVPLAPGQIIALEGPGAHLAFYDNCEDMTLTDFTIYTGVAHLYERGTRGFSKQLNIRCLTPVGSNRLIAGQPIQHILKNGTLIYDGCEFGVGWDDGINLMGAFHVVVRQESARVLIVASRSQVIDADSDLLFFGFERFDPLGGAKAVRVSPHTEPADEEQIIAFVRTQRMNRSDKFRLTRITLDHDVQIPPHTVIDCSTSRAAEVIVRNCYFHDANAQILLLQGAKKGLIENNLLERSAGAAIEVGFSMYWWEGPIPGNFIIRNNVIRDNPINLPTPRANPGSICIVGGTPQPTTVRFIHNILIENNTIYNPSCAGIYVRNADNVVIRNNRIICPGERVLADEHGKALPSAPIDLDAVSQVVVSDNTLEVGPCWADKPVKLGTEVDQVTVTNNQVRPWGNPVVNSTSPAPVPTAALQ